MDYIFVKLYSVVDLPKGDLVVMICTQRLNAVAVLK